MFQIATAAIHSTKVCNRKGKSNILSCSKSLFIAKGERPSIDQTITLSTHLCQIMCTLWIQKSNICCFGASVQLTITNQIGMWHEKNYKKHQTKYERKKPPNHQTTKTTQTTGSQTRALGRVFFPKNRDLSPASNRVRQFIGLSTMQQSAIHDDDVA